MIHISFNQFNQYKSVDVSHMEAMWVKKPVGRKSDNPQGVIQAVCYFHLWRDLYVMALLLKARLVRRHFIGSSRKECIGLQQQSAYVCAHKDI